MLEERDAQAPRKPPAVLAPREQCAQAAPRPLPEKPRLAAEVCVQGPGFPQALVGRSASPLNAQSVLPRGTVGSRAPDAVLLWKRGLALGSRAGSRCDGSRGGRGSVTGAHRGPAARRLAGRSVDSEPNLGLAASRGRAPARSAQSPSSACDVALFSRARRTCR